MAPARMNQGKDAVDTRIIEEDNKKCGGKKSGQEGGAGAGAGAGTDSPSESGGKGKVLWGGALVQSNTV